VRKRNTLVNGPIISAQHRTKSESTRRKNDTDQSVDHQSRQDTLWSPLSDTNEDNNKLIRPYFLIKPQSVLLIPNEIGKLRLIHFKILLFCH
jgi:hypothetical protein